MIKKSVFGLLFVLTATSTASAAIVEFRGGGFISNVTSACPAYVFNGFFFDTRYRPPSVGDNGPATRLALFSEFFAQSYVLPSGQLTSTFKNVQAGRTSVATHAFDNQAQMRVTAQTPSTITSTTKFVYIAGQIRNFEDVAGCQVNFQFTMTRMVVPYPGL